jgi:mRNA-degrading endonuclease RelE of RelBE toxin-antitoxin system
MKVLSTKTFDQDYKTLPDTIQSLVDRKLRIFLQNPHHPSLRIKKMEDPREIWEGRISKSYRFTFQIHEDTYILRRLGTHDILKTP